MKNAINHAEIPVTDMDRAVRCYEILLDQPLRRELFGGLPYALLPYEEPGVSAALVADPKRTPGGGCTLYVNTDGGLEAVLGRAERAGARILLGKTSIGPEGSIALLLDSEGNQVGFHEA